MIFCETRWFCWRSGTDEAVIKTCRSVSSVSLRFLSITHSSWMFEATAIIAMRADGKTHHISTYSIKLRFIDFRDLDKAKNRHSYLELKSRVASRLGSG